MNAGLYGLPGGAQARRVVGIINKSNTTTTGVNGVANNANAATYVVTSIANTWQRVAAISGRGCVNWLGIYVGTTATTTAQLVLDGVAVSTIGPFSLTAAGASGTGLILVGGGFSDNTTNVTSVVYQPLYFERSLEVNILCTTGGITVYAGMNAEVHQ